MVYSSTYRERPKKPHVTFLQVEFNPYQTDPELYQFCQKEGILLQVLMCHLNILDVEMVGN